MPVKTRYIDLGLIEYSRGWDFQKDLFDKNVGVKKESGTKGNDPAVSPENYLILCEHPHVYTLGKSGSSGNLLINQEELKNKGATFFRIDRGGDITYHGPGQIVGYPVIDLEQFGMGVKDYVWSIEETIIKLLKEYGIKGERLKSATGVWLDPGDPGKARKICAIGVRASRYITMHGFALNVNTDLSFFNFINPCGFVDKGVTSMEKELSGRQDIENVKLRFIECFDKVFGATTEFTGE